MCWFQTYFISSWKWKCRVICPPSIFSLTWKLYHRRCLVFDINFYCSQRWNSNQVMLGCIQRERVLSKFMKTVYFLSTVKLSFWIDLQQILLQLTFNTFFYIVILLCLFWLLLILMVITKFSSFNAKYICFIYILTKLAKKIINLEYSYYYIIYSRHVLMDVRFFTK